MGSPGRTRMKRGGEGGAGNGGFKEGTQESDRTTSQCNAGGDQWRRRRRKRLRERFCQ